MRERPDEGREDDAVTSQMVGILLVIASAVMALLGSLILGSLRAGREDSRPAAVLLEARGKPKVSEHRRFSPLHY